MSEAKTVCNRENKSSSDVWNRQCWIADSLVSLIHSRVEYLGQIYSQKLQLDTDPDSPFWEIIKDLEYYCDELRVKNGLRDPAVLNRDEKWPTEMEVEEK